MRNKFELGRYIWIEKHYVDLTERLAWVLVSFVSILVDLLRFLSFGILESNLDLGMQHWYMKYVYAPRHFKHRKAK